MPRYTFSQGDRIKSDDHFDLVMNYGKKYVSRSFILYFHRKEFSSTKIGFIASKKLGNAVTRNKSKRKLKELVRHLQYHIHKQYDVLLIARYNLINTPTSDLSNEFITCLQEMSIWID